ncbi:hypothetical protein V8D89_008907 [Ganoderma adspersum]
MSDLEDTGNPPSDPAASSTGTGKTKQTRRRQRLSCVVCTRRRQKCDRQIPCSLCVSRGVAQLCRWAPIVARPEPQRPPERALLTTTQQQSTIATLTARIAALEQVIVSQNLQLTWGDPQHLDVPHRTGPPSSRGSGPSTPDAGSSDDLGSSDANPALARVDLEVQFAAAKMAQLTLAPPNEFVGAGTIFCAIHKLGDIQSFRYPCARSGPTTLNNPLDSNDNPLTNPISLLVASLPPRETVNCLIEAYFVGRDWNYGLPGVWFRTACQQMWDHLDTLCLGPACRAAGGCSRCAREVNPNWLALLFAVLALSPRAIEGFTSKTFFIKAMEARRLVEDSTLFHRQYSSPPSQSVVHGVSLGCLAAALLACWLSDHGRPSDSWKLTGTAIRQAQAAGLHRDPMWYKWEKMDAQECELRVLAWWYLIISDRQGCSTLNSMILGRPTMASQSTFDVKLIPGAAHGDCSENSRVHFQQSMITLVQVVEEVVTNGLAIHPISYATILETDKKLKRSISAAYFLCALMNLHRPYLMHAPPILPPPGHRAVQNPSRERCIDAAMELVRVLCDAHEEAARWGARGEPAVSAVLFHYAYCAFDGTVALVGALSQDPPHPKAGECLGLIYRATRMLEEIRLAHEQDTGRRGEANMAARALTILAALRKAGRWDERFGRKDGAPFACHLTDTQSHAAAASTLAGAPAPELPANLHGLGGFPPPLAGNLPFDPAQFGGAGFDAQPQPSTSAAIPFLNAGGQAPAMFPCAAGLLQSAAMDQEAGQRGDLRDLGLYVSLMAPLPMDPCWSRGTAQSMSTPFEMLQNSENDIDWGAVMNSVGDTGAGENWFIG